MTTSILATKLFIPPTRTQLVHRPHLIEQLNEGINRKLVLISAPAGYGKTTLVSEWIETWNEEISKDDGSYLKFAWLSLDENDNSLSRFLLYLITAFQRIDSSIGQQAQAVFQSQQKFHAEPVLMSLVNDIVEFGESNSTNSPTIVLVLDDYHVIDDLAIHQAVEYLLEHIPVHIYMVIITRMDPPLPLAKLRARDQLVEIRGSDLHFSQQETDIFLNKLMKLDLSLEDIELLDNRTEGWIAGLQLAAISLQGMINRQEYIKTFSGDNRFVLDFLVDEVLKRQPGDIRDYLLNTSILNQMSGPLIDELIDHPSNKSETDGQGFLEYLERNNLFVIPLDDERKWYRYHHLFAEVLQNRLQNIDIDSLPLLHTRASRWYEIEGNIDLALRHALAAEDINRSAELVESSAIEALSHSRLTQFNKWYEMLPQRLIYSRPQLCVYWGWLQILIGNIEESHLSVKKIETLLTSYVPQDESELQDVLGFLAVLKSRIAFREGKLEQAEKLANESLSKISDQSPLHGHVAVIIGHAKLLNGDLNLAEEALLEAVTVAKKHNHKFMTVEATISLGYIKYLQGHQNSARAHYLEALELSAITEGQKTPIAGSAYLGIALLEKEINDLNAATKTLKKGYGYCKLFGNLQAWHIAMAHINDARGNLNGAIEDIGVAEQLDPGYAVVFEQLCLDIGRLHVWLSNWPKYNSEAESWIEDGCYRETDTPQFSERVAYTSFAKILIAQGALEKASIILAVLVGSAESRGLEKEKIELLVLQAVAFHRQNYKDKAKEQLEIALTLAMRNGFTQAFFGQGQALMELLLRINTENKDLKRFINRLSSDFSSQKDTRAQVLTEPLSEREMDVLDLIDMGLSNQDISSRLYLSLNTVKAHNRNIYAKLGVNSRTQAAATARELGILPSND